MTRLGREAQERPSQVCLPLLSVPGISSSWGQLPHSPPKRPRHPILQILSVQEVDISLSPGIFSQKGAVDLPLLSAIIHCAGRCPGPFSPAPAPRSTCARVCDTALTSVGAGSQSGAGKRSPANRGRGLRLRRQEANEGQRLALCNPPPRPAELPLGCGLELQRTGGGGPSPGQVGTSAPTLGPVSVPEPDCLHFLHDGPLGARKLRRHTNNPPSLSLSTPFLPPGTWVLFATLHRASALLTRSSYLQLRPTPPPYLRPQPPWPHSRPSASVPCFLSRYSGVCGLVLTSGPLQALGAPSSFRALAPRRP